jgi:tRNA nucleotidyltransferase (CCA-adding enzyme)
LKSYDTFVLNSQLPIETLAHLEPRRQFSLSMNQQPRVRRRFVYLGVLLRILPLLEAFLRSPQLSSKEAFFPTKNGKQQFEYISARHFHNNINGHGLQAISKTKRQETSKIEEQDRTENSEDTINGATPVSSAKDTRSTNPKVVFKKNAPLPIIEQSAKVVPTTGFNVVLTHSTADFDSLASAVGLAKLWSKQHSPSSSTVPPLLTLEKSFDSASHVPTFVVLPRGAHPGVQKFLALHKHLFPIRSLKSLPSDLSGLNRLALVDAQRRERLGPAEKLLQFAKRVTVVDHHVDQDSDIQATDYVVDKVGSVSTLIVELLIKANMDLTQAEATLLALGIHADTGSLCFDSTTPRDALALAWCLEQGASQVAIAEHAQSSLSAEQQGVLTQALMNANTTLIHGVTLSTVLLTADGFINGLAAVTQDALELSSSDIFLLTVVYETKSAAKKKKLEDQGKPNSRIEARLLEKGKVESLSSIADTTVMYAEAWKGGEEAMRRKRLMAAFNRKDVDGSGSLDMGEISAALAASGVITTPETVASLFATIDTDGDGKIDFEEFVTFATNAEKRQAEIKLEEGKRPVTMIVIGRVRAGVNLKSVKLNKILEPFGGGGHPKAASAAIRLNDESEAEDALQGIVDELITTSLQQQSTVGDFMTSPVLSVQPHMTEKQVEDLFVRYDVRALPVVDEDNDVIGLVTYKEVAAARQRLFNKEQKRLRQETAALEKGEAISPADEKLRQERGNGTTVKGWMLQHVQTIEASKTMAEVEAILLDKDIGCLPVVADGTKQLIGLVTRTDLLRQHHYYSSLHYHNKGFANLIAARNPMLIELRKRLKRFDVD